MSLPYDLITCIACREALQLRIGTAEQCIHHQSLSSGRLLSCPCKVFPYILKVTEEVIPCDLLKFCIYLLTRRVGTGNKMTEYNDHTIFLEHFFLCDNMVVCDDIF